MATYDVIIAGTGGVGSAAAWHATRRGLRVLGIDRFPPGHDRGSSHGQTRIIRQAYFEHPDYVPLLKRAYQLWSMLEEEVGLRLFFDVGLVEIGPPDGLLIPGILECVGRHQLPVEVLEPAEVQTRFPGFSVPDGYVTVFERNAGFLLVERCVLAHLAAARWRRAELRSGQTVRSWKAQNQHVEVQTDTDRVSAACLILTAGPWAGQLLAELNIPLRVLSKHLHWFGGQSEIYQTTRACPTFFYEIPDGFYYGFPQIDARGMKVAEHHGGTPVEDPLTAPRGIDFSERGRVERFVRHYLPSASPIPTDHAVCFYTMSPDEHFIVDQHPAYRQIVFAAGLSGHGFKFASVLGEALVDLACDGTTTLPIEFLRCNRPALTP